MGFRRTHLLHAAPAIHGCYQLPLRCNLGAATVVGSRTPLRLVLQLQVLSTRGLPALLAPAHLIDIVTGMLLNISHPVPDVVEGRLISDIIHKQNAHGAAIVRCKKCKAVACHTKVVLASKYVPAVAARFCAPRKLGYQLATLD